MGKRTLADKLKNGLASAASGAEKHAAKQERAQVKDAAKRELKHDKAVQKEMKKLSKLFASVSDADITKALAGNSHRNGGKTLTIKTWSNFTLLDGLPGHRLNKSVGATDGGKELSARLNEVAAKVNFVDFDRAPFTCDNIENAFIRNEITVYLKWEQNEFEESAKRQEKQNIM